MNIRSLVFWTIDFLRGSRTRKHLEEIKLLNTQSLSNEKQLDNILKYAAKNVEIYKDINNIELKNFPIINKSIILENYDNFLSDEFRDRKTHKMSTSGSTGTPFVIKQNLDKRKRVIAELLYANEKGNQEFGQKYLFVRTTSQRINKIRQIKNNEVSIIISKLSNNELDKIIKYVEKYPNISSMIAYPSTYESLLNYLKNNKITINSNIKTLFSSGAVLEKENKKELAKILDCEIIDRYFNQECGLLAQTETTEGIFKVNKASYRIELLKMNSDSHVEPGELGRIVITDLYNKAMPLIRYDNGDLGISYDSDTTNITTLERIEGRLADIIYDTNGEPISPHMWTAIMRKFPKLKQWQLIQSTKNNYVLKLNMEEDVYDTMIFVEELQKELGNDSKIQVEIVKEIPILRSGKYKATICNI